ncbi:hypothetical protein [Clostridium sp. ZS2-4]|uniref:hypothetical protein n=1 Tax=Clostridium sp. ZS2-4 TaxID=2987703 RepID=UPI00227A43C6|nr:hypothetical protein [Clostridium sp. ZS2-4]MCY6356824.1 hypothetical protein [Clostridium sp. ZS2-4]
MNEKFNEYTSASMKKGSNNMYGNNIKFKDINVNNILDLNPRDILNCLLYNRKVISNEAKKLQYQILQLTNELNLTVKHSKKIKLQKEIKDRKEVIDSINAALNKWALNKYSDIKNIIRETLEQSSNPSEEELKNMVIKIEKMMTDPKYISTPVKKIIYIILKQHEKDNSYNEVNLPVEIQQEISKSEKKNIYNQRDYEIENIEETIIPTEILNKLPQNSSNNNVKVSMFYASIDGGIGGDKLGNESFKVILLKALDLMSKLLYGTLQNQITELYEEIDKNNSNKRYH